MVADDRSAVTVATAVRTSVTLFATTSRLTRSTIQRPVVKRPMMPEPVQLQSSLVSPVADNAPRQERVPRKVARFTPGIIAELPETRPLRIDVNGVLAGTIDAIPDALRELAAGWTFMHGFYDRSSHLCRVTVRDDRLSVMVESGEDIDLRRLEAVGWAEFTPLPSPEVASEERFQISEPDLIDIIDATWHAFRKDRGSEGYIHAALAATGDIQCIARDRVQEPSIAKVFGWKVLEGKDVSTPMLFVRGIPNRRIVEAAARLGISMIVSDGIPTNEAFRGGIGASMSIVGMSTARTIGLFVDAGHLSLDEDEKPDEVQVL